MISILALPHAGKQKALLQKLFSAKLRRPKSSKIHFNSNKRESTNGVELAKLTTLLPQRISEALDLNKALVEIVLDFGRTAEIRYQDQKPFFLDGKPVTREEINEITDKIGEFNSDNRAGIDGTLHRISCIKNRSGEIIGLTLRVGRSEADHVRMVEHLLKLTKQSSILFLGRPGIGKTTALRNASRLLAGNDEFNKRVVIVDTSNEIAGDGDVPHSAIGRARRMQVADPSLQHQLMIEAVENHTPEIIIIDEIGTELECLAARTIAERGVRLIGTAHGLTIENLMRNPTLQDLVGGIETVTLGDEEANKRGSFNKTVQERRQDATFPWVVQMLRRDSWLLLPTNQAVDALLRGNDFQATQIVENNGETVANALSYASLTQATSSKI
ncbi:MAG: hypothetical protein SFU25_03030 [Candidatus Caenarcaniphilales bacterium]|nr:hypothetical protein [Candidatus Caenarcaniphilales bacterium]